MILKKLSFFFSSPQKIALPMLSKLSSRTFIVMQGPSTRTFMQQLCTNDISQLYCPKVQKNITKNQVCVYTMFLTLSGKVVADAFVYRPIHIKKGQSVPAKNQLWIDVHSKLNAKLFKHLQYYSEIRGVRVVNLAKDQMQPSVCVGFHPFMGFFKESEQNKETEGIGPGVKIDCGLIQQNINNGDEEDGEQYQKVAFFDPRSIKMGTRIIGSDLDELKSLHKEGEINIVDESQYERYESHCGFPTGSMTHGNFPFSYNLDLCDALRFDKGKYLGQKAISPLYHSAAVKRRIFPYVTKDSSIKLQINQQIFGNQGQEIGTVVNSEPGSGVAMVNYVKLMDKKWPLEIVTPVQGKILSPFHRELTEYMKKYDKRDEENV